MVIKSCTVVDLENSHEAEFCVEPLHEEKKCQNVLKNKESICGRNKSPLRIRKVDNIAFWSRKHSKSAINFRHDGPKIRQRRGDG